MENKQSLGESLQKGFIVILYKVPKSVQNLLYHLFPILMWDMFTNISGIANVYTKIFGVIGIAGALYRWFEEELVMNI